MIPVWSWFVKNIKAAYVKNRCRALVKRAGFLRSCSSNSWQCHHCNETLDEIQSNMIVHTSSGETFKYPKVVATMCPRCAWVADGSCKLPIWKWLPLKGRGSTDREFFLKNEQAGLKLRLAEIESELHPRETLRFSERDLPSFAPSIDDAFGGDE